MKHRGTGFVCSFDCCDNMQMASWLRMHGVIRVTLVAQARSKFDKVIAQRGFTDTAYQDGVRLLDGVRVDWERTMEATAQVCYAS